LKEVEMTTAPLETDLARLRSEFLLYPGMCFTVAQVARLLDLPQDEAAGLLALLESEGLLFHWTDGEYRRSSSLLS
jgi:hypothetical protein